MQGTFKDKEGIILTAYCGHLVLEGKENEDYSVRTGATPRDSVRPVKLCKPCARLISSSGNNFSGTM